MFPAEAFFHLTLSLSPFEFNFDKIFKTGTYLFCRKIKKMPFVD
ncbi:hypothetical protein B4168_0462 [Anoxybacillus flavithermus]|nr:hypothetical protein B4168_0462 [Anoxybacillus flavithermus]OAO87116.1 hypothetical protein GT23_1459 [Parageobacillus thermoglucosidasius]